jgi:hypothetical protein
VKVIFKNVILHFNRASSKISENNIAYCIIIYLKTNARGTFILSENGEIAIQYNLFSKQSIPLGRFTVKIVNASEFRFHIYIALKLFV